MRARACFAANVPIAGRVGPGFRPITVPGEAMGGLRNGPEAK